jgi:hypothetical protein
MTHFEQICSSVMPSVELLNEITANSEFDEDFAFSELLNHVVKMGMNAFNDLNEYINIVHRSLNKLDEPNEEIFYIYKSCCYTLIDYAGKFTQLVGLNRTYLNPDLNFVPIFVSEKDLFRKITKLETNKRYNSFSSPQVGSKKMFMHS